MKDVNKVILVGRLGTDPVLRHTKSGLQVTHFSLATSRRVADPTAGSSGAGSENTSGDETPKEMPKYMDETQWHRIVVWGRQGEACASYLKKGSPVFVEGSFRSRKYSDTEGADRMSFEIHADSVIFLGSRTRKTQDESEATEVVAQAS